MTKEKLIEKISDKEYLDKLFKETHISSIESAAYSKFLINGEEIIIPNKIIERIINER